jgi:hypothetical protein
MLKTAAKVQRLVPPPAPIYRASRPQLNVHPPVAVVDKIASTIAKVEQDGTTT